MGKKKAPVVLDLSKSQEAQRMAEFEVDDYDYELRQGSKVPGFEEDLQFLLSEREETPGENDGNKKRKKKAKLKSKSRESTPPISTNLALVERSVNGKFSQINTQFSQLNIGLERVSGKNSEILPGGKNLKLQGKRNPVREVQRISRKEITRDLDGIDFLSDDDEPVVHKKTLQPVVNNKNPVPVSVPVAPEPTESVKDKPKLKKNKKKKKDKDTEESKEISEKLELKNTMPLPEITSEPGQRVGKKAKLRKSAKKVDSDGSKVSESPENTKSQSPVPETQPVLKSTKKKDSKSSKSPEVVEVKVDSEPPVTSKKGKFPELKGSNKKDANQAKGSKTDEVSKAVKVPVEQNQQVSSPDSEKSLDLNSTKKQNAKGSKSTKQSPVVESPVFESPELKVEKAPPAEVQDSLNLEPSKEKEKKDLEIIEIPEVTNLSEGPEVVKSETVEAEARPKPEEKSKSSKEKKEKKPKLEEIPKVEENTTSEAELASTGKEKSIEPKAKKEDKVLGLVDSPEISKTQVPEAEKVSSPETEIPERLKSPLSPTGPVFSQYSTETPVFPRLSSAKATQIKQLPAVPPVSTIFGLTHEQIYTTKLTDVKVKTIANVPMSKMCKNALKFVMSENEGLFVDKKKTAQFVDLCTKVALYEAPGFNEVTKRIPELLEWVPQYEPLTLQHTKTNVTLSSKQIHQNTLDYTVFAFFGHILIWANELQHAANLPTITETFELGLSRNDIFESLGGYHLWDRLRRNSNINTKRWKHIQKFRQIFALEEHQFVLILRCMNLGVPIN